MRKIFAISLFNRIFASYNEYEKGIISYGNN